MGADTNTRIMAIKTGAAHATTVDPGGLVFAQKEGLVSLGFLGDLFPMPFQGFVTVGQKDPRQSRANQALAQEARFAVSCSSATDPKNPSISA